MVGIAKDSVSVVEIMDHDVNDNSIVNEPLQRSQKREKKEWEFLGDHSDKRTEAAEGCGTSDGQVPKYLLRQRRGSLSLSTIHLLKCGDEYKVERIPGSEISPPLVGRTKRIWEENTF